MDREQTKRLVRIQELPVEPYAPSELLELSRRLDALEAAHNTLAVDVEDMKPHDASGYTLPKDQPETVGERIAAKCAFWEKRRECAAAIDAAVKEAQAERDREWAEVEVKRLGDAAARQQSGTLAACPQSPPPAAAPSSHS